MGNVEAATTESFTLNARDFFSGLSNAQFGVVVTSATAQSAAQAASDTGNTEGTADGTAQAQRAASDDLFTGVTSTASASGAGLFATLQAAVQSETLTQQPSPDVIIPEEYADWLFFDEQTGLLTGTPPEGVIDQLIITFQAQDGNISLTSQGNLDIGEGATSEISYYTYDAAGRVQIDNNKIQDTHCKNDSSPLKEKSLSIIPFS